MHLKAKAAAKTNPHQYAKPPPHIRWQSQAHAARPTRGEAVTQGSWSEKQEGGDLLQM